MKTSKSIVGQLGENLACQFLAKNGYEILLRNYRCQLGELDIIARSSDKTLVFVEVKTMNQQTGSTTAELTAEDHLTFFKLKKLQQLAEMFANKNFELVDERKGWRIDLIAVNLTADKKIDIKHYQNILTNL